MHPSTAATGMKDFAGERPGPSTSSISSEGTKRKENNDDGTKSSTRSSAVSQGDTPEVGIYSDARTGALYYSSFFSEFTPYFAGSVP